MVMTTSAALTIAPVSGLGKSCVTSTPISLWPRRLRVEMLRGSRCVDEPGRVGRSWLSSPAGHLGCAQRCGATQRTRDLSLHRSFIQVPVSTQQRAGGASQPEGRRGHERDRGRRHAGFSQAAHRAMVRAADVVITMGCGDACPIYPGKRYEDWELEIPPAKTSIRFAHPRRDRQPRARARRELSI